MHIIETQHKRIPWRWIVLLQLVSSARILALFASASLTFTMRKYIDSPAIINSISSTDVFFNLLIATPCLYYSDRIWTRHGRRLPFVIASFAVMAAIIMLMPFAGGAVPIAVMVVLWFIFWDVGATFDILIMEIIPPEQRGRSSAIGAWFFNAIIMLSAIVISGRFDDVVKSTGITLRGEELIYWWGAICLIFCLLFMIFFVREVRPTLPPPVELGTGVKGVFLNLFTERTLWPVYFLAFATSLLQSSLGPMEMLLMTDQWNYSIQDMGTNVFVGGVINLVFVIPIIGLVVDRFDRLKMFSFGVACTIGLQILFFCFVQYILPDRRASIFHLILVGQFLSISNQLSGIALQPLLFDYIPRDNMGTAQAGMNLVRSVTRVITLNGVGLWVTYYSKWFMPEGKYDYFSAYIFIILVNVMSCGSLLYFARQVKRGRIKPLGIDEFHSVEETPDILVKP